MKAILAVVAVLLAVTHVGYTHNVTITESTYNVREGSCINVIVQTIVAHDFNFTVFLIIANGSEDFEVANTTVNFRAGENVSLVSLCAKDDEIVELPENFILYIQVGHEAFHRGVTHEQNGTVRIFLEDNDSGIVSFSPQNYSIPEGTDAELTFVLDKAFAIDLTFNVTTKDDTATSPDDYTGRNYSVTIPALKKEGKVSVLTAKSGDLEPDEHFIATLHAPEHSRLSTGLTTAVITINDRTIPVEFKQATYHVTEGPGVKAITITLKTVVQRDYGFAVVVSTRSGSAGDDDFQDENYMVNFQDQAKEADFTVTIFDDDIAECPEEFFLELMIPPDAGRMGVIKGNLSNAKVIINDTDCAEINFKVLNYPFDEGETVNLMIEIDKDFSCDQREVFCIQTIDDTATAGDDYVSVNKCFTFDPNTTYSVETITDATPETNECFNVTIYVPGMPCASNVKIGKKNTATVRLCDSSRARIGFKNASLNVSEGMQARLVVALDERAERDIEFTVTTRDGTADSHGEIDYFSVNTTSTIPAGTLEESVMVKTQKNRLMDPLEYFFADLSVSGECKNVDLVTKTAKITIVDISVLVSLGNDSNETVTYNVVKEDMNHTCVTLKAVGPSIETAFDVIVVATDGSATYPSDYAAREATATFLPGETTANACIPIVDDEDHECLEWFTLELKLTPAASDLCAALSSPATARVLIEDNDVVGIDFDPQTYNITEGDLGELSFSLNRTSQTNISFIAMTMNRTADGSDYVGGNFPATIHAGMKNVTLPLVTKADVLLEGIEFLEVVIKPNGTQPNCSAVVAGPPANVSIIDGTVPVKFSASVYHVCTVKGNNTSVEITLEAMKDRKFDFTVNVRTKDGTATRNLDYDEKSVIQVRFRDEQNVTIHIAIVAGGEMAEPPENFTVELEIPEDTKGKGVVAVEPSTAEIVITDVQIGTFSPQNYTVREGDVEELTIKLDRPSVQDTIFNVATMNLTATTYDDYFRHNYNITVPAEALVATTTVITQRNTKIEPEEHFKAIVRPVVECALEDNWKDTAYIKITDCTVLVKFSSAMYSVTEGMDTNVVITVLANGAVDKSNFTVRVIAKDDSATRGDDYVIKDTLLLFKQGETEHSFSINITDDMLAEPHEIFTLELEQPQQTSTVCIARGSPDITHVTIADDDVVTVSFSPQNYTVSEGIPATLRMVLDKEASESITVFVSTMDITAGSADYVQESRTPVKFAPRTKRATLPLLTLRDTLISEPDESLRVTLDLEPTTVRVEIGPDPCFVTITDATVGVNFRSDKYTVGEGDGKVTVTVDASKEHADFDFKIIAKAQDGTAKVATDLVKEEVPVTFPSGKTTVEASIEIVDDEIAECPEMFKLELHIPEIATGNGVIAIAPNTTEITIIDDDEVNITFKAPTNYTVHEGDNATIVLEVQGESSKAINVTVIFTPITAESDVDYRVESNMVTIPADANNVSVTLEALWDTECDGTETLKADLSITLPPVNVTILPATAYITILDTTVPVQFQDTAVTVEEGENVTVTLIALANHSYGFVVNVKVMDGTARRGSDYNATEVIQVPFPANENSVDFSIHIIDNDIAECQKQFDLLLEVPENATAMGVVTKEAKTAVVHITDVWDAVNITFSQMTYTVPESEEVMLKISLDEAHVEDITLMITTMDITAQSNIDYEQQGINVTIPAGNKTHTVPIQTKVNTDQENNTEFKVILGLGDNCEVRLVDDTASVTICDTRNVIRLRFKEALYHVGEGLDSNVVIGVVGAGWHPGKSFSIDVCPTDGTAKNGTDYSKPNFTVPFPDGPCTYYHDVSIIDDDLEEFPENFTLEVKIPPEAAAVCVFKGTPATATIEIIDVVQVIIRPVTTVKEGTHSYAEITWDVVRDCNEDSFNLTLVTKDGSATNDSDYNGTRFPVTIHPGQSEATVRVPIVDDFFLEDPEEFTVELEIPPESAALHVVSGSPKPVTVKIEDNDVSTAIPVSFSKDNYDVTEGETSVSITLVAAADHAFPFSVTVSTRDGTATTSDYNQLRRTSVYFRAGVNEVSFTVTLRDERLIEHNEHFYIDLEIPLAAAKLGVIKDDGSPSTATVTIINDDEPIHVRFNQTTYSVVEGKRSVSITLETLASHTCSFSVIVSTRDGTASSTSDYNRLRRTSVSFRAGVNEVSFTVTIRDERLIEFDEEFYIELEIPSAAATSCNVVKASPENATVIIRNDDEPIHVRFNQTTYSVVEGKRSVSITLETLASHTCSFSVIVSTRDGTASSTSDYNRLRRTSVSFRAGVNEVSFTVTIRDERLIEFDEEFYIELEIPSAAATSCNVVKASPENATVIIRNDDEPIHVRFNQTTYSVVEGKRSVSITLETLASHTCSFSVIVSTRDGTAKSTSDYSRRSRSSVTFPTGKNQVTFTVPIRDEGLVESDERFYIELEIPSAAARSCNVVKSSPDNATVIIRNDDVPIHVRFNQTTYSVVEGKKSVSITLVAEDHTFSFSVYVSTRDGTASSTSDYSRRSRSSVSFPSGVNAVTFTVAIRDEGLVESDEKFYIELEIPSSSAHRSVVKGSPDNAAVIIRDDDDAVIVMFNKPTYSVVEGEKSVSITLVAEDHTFSFSVYVSTRDGTASSTSDYSRLRRTSVYFRAGVNEVSFTVAIRDEGLVELDEEFYIELEIPSAAANLGVVKDLPDNATVIIRDDDVPVPVRFNQTTYSVDEGKKSVSITLVAAAVHAFSFSVIVSTRDGTASSTSDYSRRRSSVYFPARVNQVPFTVTIRDEGLVELNEEFYIELEIPSAAANRGVVKASPYNATVIIRDDDVPVPVKFSHATYLVNEGERSVSITLEALASHTCSFSVIVSTRDGTASSTSDYSSRRRSSVNFRAGVNEVSFTVTIRDEGLVEPDEEFYIELEIPSAAATSCSVVKGSLDNATVIIRDDDVPVPVRFKQTTYSVVEGKKSVSITLEALESHTCSFSVIVSTRDGTASSTSDYSRRSRTSVYFPARVNEVSFTVTIRDEGLVEPDEEFYIELEIPSAAATSCSVVKGSLDNATVIIRNDDVAVPVRFSHATYFVNEGERSVSITLEALESHTCSFSVIVSTRDGTASSTSDYSRRSRTSVYFPARVNQVTFTVTIRDERVIEPDEEFYIELEIPSAAATSCSVVKGSLDNATVIIRNDDVPVPVKFSHATYLVNEGERSVFITLEALASHTCSFSVIVSTRDGTASSTSDYSRLRRTSVYFRAGANEVTFTVTIRDEQLLEFDEEFYIELEIPSSAATSCNVVKGSLDNATVIIRDDDVAVPVRFNQTTYSVVEGKKSVSITLEALESHTCSFSVIVSTRDGTASSTSDYSRRSRTSVSFPARVNEVSFTVTIRDERLVEPDEEFYIELEIPSAAATSCSVVKGSLDNATVIIRNDDVPVPVRFSHATYLVNEGERSVSITLEALASHTCSFSVIVSTRDGTASSTSDYNQLRRTSVSFPARVNEVSFTVTIRDERLVEVDEEFYIELEIPLAAATSCSVVKDLPDNATVIIRNDDVPIHVRFNQTTYSVDEGKKSVSITLVAAVDHDFPFSVTVSTRDGTASSRTDYTSRRTSVHFRARVNEVSFTVTIQDNRLFEPTEQFYIELEIPSAAANLGVVKGSPDNATVTIRDDDVPIPVRFNQTTYSVDEGKKSVSITLVAAADHTFPFSVTVSTRDGTASSRTDYTSRRTSVYFRARVNEVSFTVTIRDEGLIESDEEFYIELEIPSAAASSNVVKGSPDNATVIIKDDDGDKAVAVNFSRAIYRVTEKDKYATITLEAQDHTFSFSVSVSTRDGTATSDDYRRYSSLVRFPAGINEATFRVSIYDDDQVENTEEFYIDLEIPLTSAYSSVIKGSPDTAKVTITDGTNGVRFNASTYKGTEGDSISVTVVADPITNCLRNFNVSVTLRDGSATSGADYSALRIPVTFDFEETVKSFTVDITDDDLYENTEDFFLDLEIPPEAVLEGVFKESPASTKIEIANNDDCVIPVKFGSSTYTVGEKQRSFTGTLETPAYYPRSFTVYVEQNSTYTNATVDDDYRSARIPVTFSSARHERPFTVTVKDDFILEFGEYFFLDLDISTAPPNCIVTKASPERAIVHIKDDERVIPVKFSSSNYTVGENERSFTGTLETPGYHDRPFTVYVVTNNTNANAAGGTDYRSARIPVTFNAGRKESTFTVTIRDDVDLEFDEYFFLDLDIPLAAAAYGVTKGSPERATVNIEDDEYEIPVRFSHATYNVTEGQRVGYVPITLEVLEDRTFSFKVSVSTRDGSAEADKNDYRTFGTDITISPRQNSYTFSVLINPDEEPEFPEDFYIDLSIPPEAESRGVRLGSPDTAKVVIEDDDLVLLTLDPVTEPQEEDVGTVDLTITASKPAEFPYNVTINTRAGTAEANVDFKPGPYYASFKTGDTTATVSVLILDDRKIEEDEKSFHCFLNISDELVSKGIQVDPSAPASTNITIRDNDVEVEFQLDTLLAVESDDDPENITVLARGDLRTSFTISIIANITAGGADVTDFNATDSVTFKAEGNETFETETFFPFLATCDTKEEGNEVVRLELQVPEQDQHRISIIGNDHIEVVIVDNCSPNPGLREINDTVFSNPVYTVPILNFTEGSSYKCNTAGYPMCYQVDGEANKFLNLISDNCVSVNAHYVAAEDPTQTVIKAIGVVATDRANRCHYVNVSVTEDGTCEATVDGVELVNDSIVMYGFAVKHRNRLVRIDAPNCGLGSEHLVMWVHCQRVMGRTMPQTLIKFIINRGLCQRPSAHGLIGQFWGVPTKLEPITAVNFTLTLYPPGAAKNRTMLATVAESTWTQMGVPAIPSSSCLYVGSGQAGPDPPTSDSVIEGMWRNYTTNSLFDTVFSFSRYRELTCGI